MPTFDLRRRLIGCRLPQAITMSNLTTRFTDVSPHQRSQPLVYFRFGVGELQKHSLYCGPS